MAMEIKIPTKFVNDFCRFFIEKDLDAEKKSEKNEKNEFFEKKS